ncbi:MAG: S-layer homology domain-containing protein, partial [bacterium]|nr:S-layer homology domain-containing protein [bacterium]
MLETDAAGWASFEVPAVPGGGFSVGFEVVGGAGGPRGVPVVDGVLLGLSGNVEVEVEGEASSRVRGGVGLGVSSRVREAAAAGGVPVVVWELQLEDGAGRAVAAGGVRIVATAAAVPPAVGTGVGGAAAVAAGGVPGWAAVFDACAAAPVVRFADAVGGAAGCVAAYGVMEAWSPGVFSPGRAVSGVELAEVLARLAVRVGLDVGAGGAPPVEVLAALGVGGGPGGVLVSQRPAGRGEAALVLAGLMEAMVPLRGADGSGRWAWFGHRPSAAVGGAGAPFGDLGGVSGAVRAAVERLWQLGVVSGSGVFGPGAALTRGALAGWVAGVLGHSNARPAGLAVQPGRVRPDGTV